MNIAKIHVWKVPVLLYGDLADRVLIYIHGQGGRKEEAESFAEIATNYGENSPCPRSDGISDEYPQS